MKTIIKNIITNNWFLYFLIILLFTFIADVITYNIQTSIYHALNLKMKMFTLHIIIYFPLYLIFYSIFNFRYMYMNRHKIYNNMNVTLSSKTTILKYHLLLEIRYYNKKYDFESREFKFKNILHFYFIFGKSFNKLTEEDYLIFLLNKHSIKVSDLDDDDKIKIIKKLRTIKMKRYVS